MLVRLGELVLGLDPIFIVHQNMFFFTDTLCGLQGTEYALYESVVWCMYVYQGRSSSAKGDMMHALWLRVRRSLRLAYLKVLRIKASPHSIALGMAVGVFVGCLPVIPFQTVIALSLAFVLRCNKITAALGTWVSNPANVVVVYYFLYRVGSLVVPGPSQGFDPAHLALTDMLAVGWQLVLIMSAGGIIIGIPAAMLTYVLTARMVQVYRARRAARRLKHTTPTK